MKIPYCDYMSIQANKDEIRKTFFDHWRDDIPLLLEIDQEMYESSQIQARFEIIDVLAIGIDDIYPGTQEVKKRRVLNASEIKEEINKRLNHKIKKSNLYFHLKKLEEIGFIELVNSLPYGKREIAYYGRTARAFVPKGESEKMKHILLDHENVQTLIKDLNTSITDSQIVETLEKLSGIYTLDTHGIVEWMNKNEDKLRSSEIDFRKLFEFLSVLQRHNQTVSEGIIEMAEMLGFKQN